MDADLDYYVETLNETTGKWNCVKTFKAPRHKDFLVKTRWFFNLIPCEVFDCYKHHDAAVQKRAEAVEFARTLQDANVQVRGFNQIFTQLGDAYHEEVVWRNGRWLV